jgi:DNA-binding transcriptional MerR regulator
VKPKYHSTESAAALLDVSSETVRRYIAAGVLAPVYNIGTTERPRYRLSDSTLRRFIRSRKVQPSS